MPPAAPPSRLAIYTRQSVDTAKDFSSCDAKFQTCLDCAGAFNDRDGDWIGERFDDQGWSGSSADRPALKRLRKAVREGRVRHVYAVTLKVRVRDDAALLFGQTPATGVPPSCPPTRTAE
ncbi:MAG: recombinase family protein [bacterium]